MSRPADESPVSVPSPTTTPPTKASERRTSHARQALVVVGIIALLIAVVLPTLLNWLREGQFQRNARRCPTNLRQIGLAMQMYANDHGGQVPPTPDLILDATSDATVSPETFVCPFTHDHAATGATTAALHADLVRPGHNSYVFTGLTGRFNYLTSDHVLAHDRPGNHDGMNVLFGDGHVQWLDEAQTAHLLAELNAGHNPPRPAGAGGTP